MAPPVKKEMKKDVGWSWVVLAAAFIINAIIFGQLLCFGIYLVVLRDYFDANRSEVALIGSVAYGTKCLTGLVSSVACRKFGCRPVLMLAGIVSAVGCVLSYYAATANQLILTYGLLNGFGFGLAFTPSLAVLPDYFERWKYFATAFATVGAACGTFIFQPIFYHMIEIFTWRGSMLINAGIVLQITVCGCMMKNRSAPGRVSLRDVLETSLFADTKMWLMLCNCACWGATVYSVFSMINLLVLDIGLTKAESAQVASAVGLANVFGRTSASFLGQANLISRPLYYTLATFTLSIGALSAAAFKLLIPTAIGLIVFGFGFGSMLSQLVGVLIHLFSVQRLVNALGYCMFAVGIGGISFPPIAGWIADRSSVATAYALVGFVGLLGSVLVAVVTGLAARNERQQLARAQATVISDKGSINDEEIAMPLTR